MRWVVISLSVQTNKQTNYTGRHRCTLRMFISSLIRYLNKSAMTCGQGDLGSLQFAVCSLLYPDVEEEDENLRQGPCARDGELLLLATPED